MILDQLADYSRQRVEENRRKVTDSRIKAQALGRKRENRSFRDALKKDGISLISEVKKASPSKGVIDPVFDYISIAEDYERAGADAVSCLTEPKWFLGSREIFEDIRKSISLPLLRKDFTVDEYQIYEARAMGADAVLLITAILEAERLKDYIETAKGLGLDALVEAHDEKEIEISLKAGADIIGVNNRNLKDFSMNLGNASSLRSLVPDGVVFVAESGIRNRDDVRKMEESGADAVLVGETLMRAADRKREVNVLKGLEK